MAITVYRWDDASAPSLTNAAGGLLTVLDAVLVNGYGSKLSQGWTKPFGTSTNVTVYQQPTGTNQRLLRVDDNGNLDSSNRLVRVGSYETMSDMNTGSGLIPTTLQNASGYVRWVYARTNTVLSPLRWIIVAEPGRFLLLVETYCANVSHIPFKMEESRSIIHFYGELEDASLSDAYGTSLSGDTTSSGVYTNSLIYSLLMYTHRSFSQVGGGISLLLLGHTHSAGTVMDFKYPNSRGFLMHSSISCRDNLSGSTGSAIDYEYRGRLPYVSFPNHSYSNLKNAGVLNLDTFSDGINTYMVFMTHRESTNGYFYPIPTIVRIA